MRRIALDTNLLVLLVVGDVKLSFVCKHKRLRIYGEEDWALLRDHIGDAQLSTTPNAMTEAANLIVYGVEEPLRSGFLEGLTVFLAGAVERYIESDRAAALPEYCRLGLADAAWLALMDGTTELLTDDLALYLAASKRGVPTCNFNHLREGRTTP